MMQNKMELVTRDNFIHAARNNDLNTVTRFVELNKNKPEEINATDSSGENALIEACCWGNIKIVGYLLAQPAIDPNVKNSGVSLLLYTFGLDLKFKIDEMGANRRKAILALLAHPKIEVKVKQNNNTLLHLACKSGYPDLVAAILKKEQRINAMNNEGDTPLMVAVKSCIRAGSSEEALYLEII